MSITKFIIGIYVVSVINLTPSNVKKKIWLPLQAYWRQSKGHQTVNTLAEPSYFGKKKNDLNNIAIECILNQYGLPKKNAKKAASLGFIPELPCKHYLYGTYVFGISLCTWHIWGYNFVITLI